VTYTPSTAGPPAVYPKPHGKRLADRSAMLTKTFTVLSVKRVRQNPWPLNRSGCYSEFILECKSFLKSIKKFLRRCSRSVLVPNCESEFQTGNSPEFDSEQRFALTKKLTNQGTLSCRRPLENRSVLLSGGSTG
jgi:hypothetical protein